MQLVPLAWQFFPRDKRGPESTPANGMTAEVEPAKEPFRFAGQIRTLPENCGIRQTIVQAVLWNYFPHSNESAGAQASPLSDKVVVLFCLSFTNGSSAKM